jgi:hypothetical protein
MSILIQVIQIINNKNSTKGDFREKSIFERYARENGAHLRGASSQNWSVS